MSYLRFVAIGDSCTEGIDDPYPDGRGYRGWADLVAAALAQHEPGLRYANLAVRGRRLDQIHAEQVPTARTLRPDLASVFGGGNDVLQGRWDPERMAASLDTSVRELSAVARTVLMFTLPDLRWHRFGVKRLRRRIAVLNAAVAQIADRHGAVLIDVRDDPATMDRRYYGADRLHLGERGHQRLAAHVLRRIEVPAGQQWLTPLPAPEPEPLRRKAATELRWLRGHALPAAYGTIRNRMIGRQPGDGFVPKLPELRPFGRQAQ
ncbi:MAG: SGNH/GDSL hydrolase family protein [Actinophytocola sp.]|nr:SGNH/GDSL hydrolase family protein [Actinophytocola sp.]